VANTIFHLLTEFFARYGYWVVFFGVMLENVGVPVPGETVLLFAGFLAFQGKLRIVPAILTAMAGATVGAALGYAVGWYGGASVVNRLLARFPRLKSEYDSAQKRFLDRGHWAVFAARFITGVRVFAGVLAGVLKMPFSSFLLFSFAGAVCWAVVIGLVGFLFGSSWETLLHVVGRLDRAALILIVCGAGVYFLIHFVRRRRTS
jgi:membrane protein DedA with SNARE-associated domain